MFTGISEELGKVISFKNMGRHVEIEIECEKVLENTKIGDSIMTDGVCLTVKEINDNSYKADIMEESLKMTKFDISILNKKVNLERAMRLSDRLDGHIVQGHVDGVGKIKKIVENVFTIECNDYIQNLVVKKGSISLDGISLTVSGDNFNNFSVSLIPETFYKTNFKYKKVGDKINIETDIIQRFIQKSITKKERLDKNFLLENGF
ncbi:riboflavin synthase [Anaerococcus sp. AGMB00486]|uniref:Riboflavin synthase n=2 Tax=Anaerococcus TaxID=165779 RepID=A0ABX2N813_9FIRM|nr:MULTISPECIES: riboflavin synthase [Anaerococcus]MSS78385.1 riboflavin synthase [Anaerococcus porci]NVF10709.1 riboflavin synthase [Anaerococcus faecalis]